MISKGSNQSSAHNNNWIGRKFCKTFQNRTRNSVKRFAGSASSLSLKTMQGMKNDQLVKLGEQPGGSRKIGRDEVGAETRTNHSRIHSKELDRLNSATFTQGPGLKDKWQPKRSKDYIHLVRQEMLTSPSFAKTMNEINNDGTRRPTIANVGRDVPKVRLDDRFEELVHKNIDLNDFDKLPRELHL